MGTVLRLLRSPIQGRYRNTKIHRTEPTRRIAGAIGAGYRA